MSELLCATCGRANPPGFRFCGGCGAGLGRECLACGAPATPDLDFCGQCGARLDAAEPADQRPTAHTESFPDRRAERPNALDERKVVTVLYADLVASTELATQLDPEELQAVLGPFFETMTHEISRHGGTVEKYIGDAIVAVFGHPIAREDHAERAVRAAVAMQARLAGDRAVSDVAEGRLAMRIGVNTGDVLAGPGSDRGGSVTGDAISLAARLQELATPGSVIVADRTRRLTRRTYAYRDLGEVTLKGVDRAIRAWEALPDVEPDVEPSDLRSVMIGRNSELALLSAVFDRTTRARAPALVTVVGPPGIGKSRLTHEFAGSLANARVVRGRCLAYGDGVALWPMAEILKSDAGILDSDLAEVIASKASGRLDPRFGGPNDTSKTTPVLLSSIGIGLGVDPLAGQDSDTARRAIASAWQRYFESISSNNPVVALIEDIHWADPGLLDLVESLAASVAGPVEFICTARPELWEVRPTWGAAIANANTIALAPLSGPDGAELIRHLLAGDGPRELVERIVQQSDGNPFYVGELLRMMIEDGTLGRHADGTWRITGATPTTLPDTIQGAIASRLDLLGRSAKRTIQDASVVGRVFWVGVLDQMQTPDKAAAVEELIDRGLIVERDGSAIEGERELMFNHILTRDVAYASVPRVRRVEAHAMVLHWIERVTAGRDEEFAEILWRHASEAGDLEPAARFAMLAGYRHRRVYAADEAIRWYDRALEALDRAEADPGALVRFEMLLARGEANEQLGRWEAARSDLERARSVARLRPAGSREWLEGRALAALVGVAWSAGHLDDAEALLPEALAAATDQRADDLIARLSAGAGSAALLRGDPAGAIAYHERALAVALEAEDREGEAVARLGLGEAALVVGGFPAGLDQARQADARFRELGQRPLVHRSERLIAMLLWATGEPGQAVESARTAVTGARAVASRRDLVAALATLGFVSSSAGDLGQAIRSTDEAAELAARLGTAALTIETFIWRAIVSAELDDLPRLADELGMAIARADATDEAIHRGPLLAARGWIELSNGDQVEARATFDDAVGLAGGSRVPAFLTGRLMLLAGISADSAEAVATAADLLATAATDAGPPFAAWATYATALASMRRGDPRTAERDARSARSAALATHEQPIAWRSCAVLGDALLALGRDADAEAARREAAAIIGPMLATVEDSDRRSARAARPDVAALLGGGSAVDPRLNVSDAPLP